MPLSALEAHRWHTRICHDMIAAIASQTDDMHIRDHLPEALSHVKAAAAGDEQAAAGAARRAAVCCNSACELAVEEMGGDMGASQDFSMAQLCHEAACAALVAAGAAGASDQVRARAAAEAAVRSRR